MAEAPKYFPSDLNDKGLSREIRDAAVNLFCCCHVLIVFEVCWGPKPKNRWSLMYTELKDVKSAGQKRYIGCCAEPLYIKEVVQIKAESSVELCDSRDQRRSCSELLCSIKRSLQSLYADCAEVLIKLLSKCLSSRVLCRSYAKKLIQSFCKACAERHLSTFSISSHRTCNNFEFNDI